jgi:amino acid transporter
MSSAAFILLINTLVPVALTGGVGAKTVGAYDYVGALNHLVGKGATNFFVIVICLSFVLSMNTATADGSRALYGISKDGLTIKQLGRLNRFNVPGYAMTLDMGINILFVLFVGNLFGILVASNIGYVLANMFAIGAFVLLRRDRPDWPRPIRLPDFWVPIAVALFAASSASSASAGSRSRAAEPSTAARETRSSASPSSPLPSCSSCSGGSSRTGRGRTGARRRR